MTTRVLHIIGSLDVGGAEIQTLNTYQTLLENGCDIQFDFFTTRPAPGALEGRLFSLGGGIVRGDLHKKPLRTLWACYRSLREGQYEFLHSHVYLFSGAFLLIGALAGTRDRIAHFRTTHDGKPDTLPRGIYRLVMKALIGIFATRIIGVSRSALESGLLCQRWKRKSTVIYHGVKVSEFYLQSTEKELRQEFGLGGEKVVITVARFTAAKNLTCVVRTARLALEADPDLVFLMVGDGPLLDEVREQIAELGLEDHFRLAGFRRDIPRLLSRADVFFLPSLWEGFGNVYLEALASGLPVVASDISAVREILGNFPGRVLMAPPRDPQAQAGHLLQALEMPRLTKKETEALFKGTQFNGEVKLKKLLEVYRLGAR